MIDEIIRLQYLILGGIIKIMATEQDLQDSLNVINNGIQILAAKFADQSAQIAALKDQIAQGTPVSQAQLDNLESNAQAIEDALAALIAQ